MTTRVTASILFFSSFAFPVPSSAEGFVSPSDAEQIALETHPSVRMAKEEADLAELKKDEAYRALWPSVALKGERTDGFAVKELGTPGFREVSYGVQASQPILQGGKLYRTYRQSRAAWESSVVKMEKARQEVLFGARESTWNYVKALRARDAYRRALDDLSKERAMADKLSAQGVIPRQVHLTVTAHYHQARLALDGAEAELTARVWQWAAALGLTELPEFRPAEDIPAPVFTDLTLEDCLRRAEQRHPDLLVQIAATEAALHGDKAGRSLYFPRLSASGFYGRSGGNFDSEPLEVREDWQAGLQLNQYFGGTTANLSGFHQKTSPKIGQTSRTESRTVSASLGLFDALKQRTERREATFGRHQADVQLDRARMEVANNLREAYANWRKALAGLSVAENELALARSDYAIARVKSAHREVPLSERAASRNKQAQSEAAYVDAQAGYNTAAAALSRAAGDPDLFQSNEIPEREP